MLELTKQRSKKYGLPPGTLMHIGEQFTEKVRISVFEYDEENLVESELATVEECFSYIQSPLPVWVNVDGIHDVDVIAKLGEYLGVHPLLLEDILNTDQRPKIEDFEKIIYLVVKMMYLDKKGNIKAEQVSFILGDTFVITFQEGHGDCFDPIRERLRKHRGRLRSLGADYLVCCLLDNLVDAYFSIFEQIGNVIEEIDEMLSTNPPDILADISHQKHNVIFIRKYLWPLRDVMSRLKNGDSDLIRGSTLIYFKDVDDHVIQLIDTVEMFREMLADIVDIHLSINSNRLNEVFMVLTIIATIFIPLTFIVGVYGMNFSYMPELEWKWGYFTIWLIMISLALSMIFFFHKKNGCKF